MKNSKLLANNWVVTLTATLVGVLVALYLNERVAANNLNTQKEIATKNIRQEIISNQINIEKSITKHTEFFDFIKFKTKYTNDENEFIAPVTSINEFRMKYPHILSIKDSTLIRNGVFKYEGTSNFDNIYSLYLDLATIAWESLRGSGLSTSIDYECLMYLQSIDILTNKIVEKNEVFFEYLTETRESGSKNKHLINHLELLIFHEKALLEIYKRNEKELDKCG